MSDWLDRWWAVVAVAGFLALLYFWVWLSGRIWPETRQAANSGASLPRPLEPPPRAPTALELYEAHDKGPGGTARCPVPRCDGGEVDVGTPGVNSVVMRCVFCSGGTVSLRAWRAYRKTHDLFPRLAAMVESDPTKGPALADSLKSYAERLGKGLPDDRDVLTVYLGLLHGGPLVVDGYGDLTT